MTIDIRHAFTAVQGDGTDATLVKPSNWNANHAIKLAANTLVGRIASSPAQGPAEEIALSAFMAGLLSSADLNALITAFGGAVFSTGDVKFTVRNNPPAGWVMANDSTIGSTASGASNSSDDNHDLFVMIWNCIADTYCPVYQGATPSRGPNAEADWAANKTIFLPKVLGRVLAGAGTGSGLSARPAGAPIGEENHQLSIAEMPSHNHGGQTGDDTPDHGHNLNGGAPFTVGSGTDTRPTGSGVTVPSGPTQISAFTSGALQRHIHPVAAQGSSAVHNNMQPTTFLYVMFKK